jgi:5'-deoxynucleotidase YfbR-like HD superfamily hydrolase
MLETIFSSDDLAFLARQNRHFPQFNLEASFLKMANVPAPHRIRAASEWLQATPRRGGIARGLPLEHIETVAEHTAAIKGLAAEFNRRSHPPLTQAEFDYALLMADVHDMPESVTGDIIPRDGMVKADKARLEDMAARLIFETDPVRLAAFREYDRHETRVARWVGDLDKLQLMKWVRATEQAYPEHRAKLSDFWPNALNTVKTALAKSEMARLVASHQLELVPA